MINFQKSLKISQIKPLIICGPSGAGKSTIISHLLQKFDLFELLISHTTREKR